MISEDVVYIDADPSVSTINYYVDRPDDGWRRVFPPEYVDIIRPIAETLAMLDGNAFFGEDWRSWINYLPEADAVYRANNSPRDVSWLTHHHHNDPTLADAWNKYQTLLALKRKK
jgi:hypothetical protein